MGERTVLRLVWGVLLAGALLAAATVLVVQKVSWADAAQTPRSAAQLSVQATFKPSRTEEAWQRRQTENKGYRDQAAITEEQRNAALPHLRKLTAVFERAVRDGVVTPADVQRLVRAEGYAGAQVKGASNVDPSLAVAVHVDGVCIVGGMRADSVELEVRGLIADGGCLSAN